MKRLRLGGFAIALMLAAPLAVRAEGNLHHLKHIIIVMQENHSFDNYLGVLPYVSGSPYHSGPCTRGDHTCVDGLHCTVGGTDTITCTNSNVDNDSGPVTSFHETKLCIRPDLDHSWPGSHLEANYTSPNSALQASPNDGFVRQNDMTEQLDVGSESATEDDTMGFYTPAELPFYYQLAQTFAIDDRYFCSVAGPTFPNRSYLMAATSFGHLDTAEIVPDISKAPSLFYRPITGTIFDLLDHYGVSWADYSDDVPQGISFRDFAVDQSHFRCFSSFIALGGLCPFDNPNNSFLQDAQAGTLPAVVFVDPSFGFLDRQTENDEGPPTDIRAGEAFVAQAIKAVRSGPNWKDSIIFVTYDEHGGFYDHVAPAKARQGGGSSPDGIQPGLCEDLSNPPVSEAPGGGLSCLVSMTDAELLCPLFDPSSGSYPSFCANFNQLGFRVPFLAISPFSKPHYVSHTVGDHTSLLALIEKRFFSLGGIAPRRHLTARDQHADTLEDMFDFNHSPSVNASIPDAPAASADDNGCS
jgi:phospholipase C